MLNCEIEDIRVALENARLHSIKNDGDAVAFIDEALEIIYRDMELRAKVDRMFADEHKRISVERQARKDARKRAVANPNGYLDGNLNFTDKEGKQ